MNETRRERLYRVGNRAETRYQRRRADARLTERMVAEADGLVARLVDARLDAWAAETEPGASPDCPERCGHGAGTECAAEMAAIHRAEERAEGAWLRAAEMGGPEQWAEEDEERQREAYL